MIQKIDHLIAIIRLNVVAISGAFTLRKISILHSLYDSFYDTIDTSPISLVVYGDRRREIGSRRSCERKL